MLEDKALRMVREAKVLSYDTETTGLTLADVPCGYVFSDGVESLYVPVRHTGGGNIEKPEQFETALNGAFRDRTGYTIGHNLAFDMKMGRKQGIVLNKNLIDTQINEGLIDDYTPSYSLAACAERHQVEAKKGEGIYEYLAGIFGGDKKPAQMGNFHRLRGDDAMAVDYACGDGITTYQLAESQQKDLQMNDLHTVWRLECDLIWYIDEMHARGMRIDMDHVPEVLAEVHMQQQEAANSLPIGLNPRSPKQMKQLFDNSGYTDYPLTPKGSPSFREKWLETNPLGQSVLKLRRLKKLEESFITPLVDTYNVQGRVHAELNQSKGDQYGTVTGRLSCSNPNLQAFPKRNREIGEIVRALVIPDDGMIIYEDDYQQQEPRLFAHYSGDPNLMKGYMADPFIDVHTNTSQLLSMPRPIAKRLSMGMLTGLGKKALAGHMECTPDEAEFYYRAFFSAYPHIKKFQRQAQQAAEVRGYVKTALGRRATFSDRSFAYKATSRIIQGTGADHTKQGLLNACKFAESEGNINMLMTIHDSFVYQAEPDADVAGLRREIERSAEQLGLKVPIPLEHGCGKNWAEASYGA